MAKTQADAEAAASRTTEPTILDRIVAQSRVREPEAKKRFEEIIRIVIGEVLQGTMTVSPNTEAMINARIAEIDRLISAQLNMIMQHPEFQRLESAWRGLKYLLSQSDTGEMLKIKVLNVSKKELLRDLERAPEFDLSALYKKVYSEEFDVFGGSPFGALVGDYEFGRSGEDIELLEKISQVAAAAHAPFLSGASPEMFNLDSFTQLDRPSNLAKVFDNRQYARWKAFRETEDSRYVGLTVPRMLLREPYGPTTRPLDAFDYDEQVDGTEHSRYLWGNAAWALAARITNAFATYGWCAAIRGVESGGLVEGLPVHTFRTDAGDVAMKCPTETPVTETRDLELANQGFIALVHCKDTPNAAFFSVQSCQKPKVYNKDAATANARVSAQLPYMFAVSRFAHYLKKMMLDRIGGYSSREEIESFLNRWIENYVVDSDSAGFALKAEKPLREARVDVVEVPGKPGAYRAVAFLRPHFQLEELTVAMRLVADLPAPAG